MDLFIFDLQNLRLKIKFFNAFSVLTTKKKRKIKNISCFACFWQNKNEYSIYYQTNYSKEIVVVYDDFIKFINIKSVDAKIRSGKSKSSEKNEKNGDKNSGV